MLNHILNNIDLIIYLISITCFVSIFYIIQKKSKGVISHIAQELSWNYSKIDVSDYKNIYLFKQFVFKESKVLSGKYKNLPFKIFFVPPSEYSDSIGDRIIVEIEGHNKYQGVHIAMKELYVKPNRFNSNLKRVYLESDEFNKIFIVHALLDHSPFYDLDPDTIVKLIDMNKHFKHFALETYTDKLYVFFGKTVFNEIPVLSIYNNKLKDYTKEYLLKILDQSISIHTAFK